MQKYEEAMALISHAARYKMQLNAHKGDIETCPADKCIEYVGYELAELERAVRDKDYEKIIVEAADCHNFLVALVYQATAQYRARKQVVAQLAESK